MAIYSAVPPPEDALPASSQTPPPASYHAAAAAAAVDIDIDAWTVSALQSLSISPVARGIGSPLTIPIDELHAPASRKPAAAGAALRAGVSFTEEGIAAAVSAAPGRPPSRRDSQRKREAVLKGKEGSRQRRRWENDRLMHVPNAQPPLPADWDVQPTHPVHRVPYQLAQFWDRGPRQRAQDRAAHLQAARKTQQRQAGRATGSSPGEVPRDLREAVKRSGGGGGGGGGVVRGWVSGLEEPVRRFLLQQQQQQHQQQQQNSGGSDSSEDLGSDDEQIVFAGRSDAMRDLKEKRERCKVVRREGSHEAADSGLVFDSLGDDESAAFKRWLTHAIADYYGLESRSVTLRHPTRRVTYVGFKKSRQKNGPLPQAARLPRPLWEVC